MTDKVGFWARHTTLAIVFDSLEEIVSILLAAYLLWLEYGTSQGLTSLEMVPYILFIVSLLALSGLRDKLYRDRRIARGVEKIEKELDEKVFDSIRVQNVFNEKGEPDEDFFYNSQDIDICGITLIRTIGKYHGVINRQVYLGSRVRIILIDPTADAAIEQLIGRSWGRVTPEYYRKRLESTVGQVKVIADNINSSEGRSKEGSLEIGYLPFVPSFGILMRDPELVLNGASWIELYHHLTNDPGPAFLVERYRDDHWFSFFEKQFAEMWKICRKETEVLPLE